MHFFNFQPIPSITSSIDDMLTISLSSPGKFMYTDSRPGILAQKTTLTSVMGKFEAETCLSFYLFLKFTKDDSYRKFRFDSKVEVIFYVNLKIVFSKYRCKMW